MLAVTLSPDPARLPARAAVVAVSAIVAVNARGLSPLWVLAALAVPLLLVGGRTALQLLRQRSVLLAIAAVAVGTIAALGWTLATNSLANAIAHPEDALQFPGVGASPFTGFQRVLVGTVDLQGLVGLFGWLDTPAPEAVLFAWGVAIGSLAIGALLVLRGRRLLVAAVLVGAFLLLPALVQAVYIHGGGMIWQGRYNLPLFLCLVIGLAALLDGSAFRSPHTWRRLRLLLLGGALAGQLWAFAAALRRYAVGANGSVEDLPARLTRVGTAGRRHPRARRGGRPLRGRRRPAVPCDGERGWGAADQEGCSRSRSTSSRPRLARRP